MECRDEGRPEVDRHLFGAHSLMTELLQTGKWTDWNANFHTMINLQYEIVGTELSPRGCTLLLYSISQLLPAITVNPHCPPHTKPLLHYIYQALYKRWKHMTAELCFLQGWGPSAEGGDLQLAHGASVHWARRQWHHEGHLQSSPSVFHTSSYRFKFAPWKLFMYIWGSLESTTAWGSGSSVHDDAWMLLSNICFCSRLRVVANHLTIHL